MATVVLLLGVGGAESGAWRDLNTISPRLLVRSTGTIVHMDAKGDRVALYVEDERFIYGSIELYQLGKLVGRWPARCGDPGVVSIAVGGDGVGWVCIESGSTFEHTTLQVNVPGKRAPVFTVETGVANPWTDVVGDGRLLSYNLRGRDLMVYDGRRQRRVARQAGPPCAMDGLTITYLTDDGAAAGDGFTLMPDGSRWKIPDPPIGCSYALSNQRLVVLDEVPTTLRVYDAHTRKRTGQWTIAGEANSHPSLSAHQNRAAYLAPSGPRIVELTRGRVVSLRVRYPGAPPARNEFDASPRAILTAAGLFYSYNDSSDRGWLTLIPSPQLPR